VGLDDIRAVDAIGIDKGSGSVVLTIFDGWDWKNEEAHLLSLQNKLDTYMEFIEPVRSWSLIRMLLAESS
jgi:hypothetical protein